ncbi:MAG: hypothetical protein H6861_04560 [Rhodospirillales bacterium]|nr:hypothetical protein [Rhodospirillales bacterium]
MALGSAFDDNLKDLTGAGAEKEARAPSLLSGAWMSVRERDNDDLLGLDSKNKAGLQERGAALAKSVEDQRQRESEKAKRRTDDILLLALLDQIDAWEQDLKSRYGEDYAQGMLQQLLTDEERDGLTYEEQLQVLFGKYLDEKGEPIVDTQEARDVAKLYKTMQAKEIALDINSNGLDAKNSKAMQDILDKGSIDEVVALGENVNARNLKQAASDTLDNQDIEARDNVVASSSLEFDIPII